MRVYTARWVLPVSSPPLEGGAIACSDGKIVAVGRRADVLAALSGDVRRFDLGDAVVLPGLVNAHTHVELSFMGEDPPPADEFAGWVRGLLDRRRRVEPGLARAAARSAIEALLRRGTVAIGDLSNDTWVVPLLAASDLSGIAFHEIYGFLGREADGHFAAAEDRLANLSRDPDVIRAGGRLKLALTAHAPHTTSARLITRLVERAAAEGGRLSIHVAESRAESDLLATADGPFVELLQEGAMWDPEFRPAGLSPVAYLDRLHALTPHLLAVHCIRLSEADRASLRSSGATVVVCPRSNRRLGLGRTPVPQLVADGVPVALGTDSLASAPDLDLFCEMAALAADHPSLSPDRVLHAATAGGAAALGLDDRFGRIAAGYSDRLIVVPLARAVDDPHESICSVPRDVFSIDRAPAEAAGR